MKGISSGLRLTPFAGRCLVLNNTNKQSKNDLKRKKKRNKSRNKSRSPVSVIKPELVPTGVTCIPEKKLDEKEAPAELDEPFKWPVVEGDTVDINDLLFTPERNYLVTNKGLLVKDHDLKGKVIVVFFAGLCHPFKVGQDLIDLIEVYQQLQGKGGFECVFVGALDDPDESNIHWCIRGKNCDSWNARGPKERFDDIFSSMAWPAIPYSDQQARNKAFTKIVGTPFPFPTMYIIDPSGKVLFFNSNASEVLNAYGAEAFPFTEERIRDVHYQDEAARRKPSLQTLLAFSDRDFVISHDGKKVPISELNEKVVGLFIYEYGVTYSRTLVERLMSVYEELKSRGVNFEVVLINLHFKWILYPCASDDTLWNRFKSMPWMTLPFKDPNCRRLRRIFRAPDFDEKAMLSIIGPHGSYNEFFGGQFLERYGVKAYPFTRDKVLEIEIREARKLKLDALLHKKVVMGWKCDHKVDVSKLSGKQVLLLFADDWCSKSSEFLRFLENEYRLKKGTIDEFEVIFLSLEEKKPSCVEEMPWLVHPFKPSTVTKLRRVFRERFSSASVAFGQNGKFLAKEAHVTRKQRWMHTFPYINVDLNEETRKDLLNAHSWLPAPLPYPTFAPDNLTMDYINDTFLSHPFC